jgi:hypothetical protein
MAINREQFFDVVREEVTGGKLSKDQVDGSSAILDYWEKAWAKSDDRWLAYTLGTAYHESARTMQPVRETKASTDDKAIAILWKYYLAGKLPWVKKPYWDKDKDGKTWLGRGLVQLTHKTNYERLTKATGIDLVKDPSQAMEMDAAVKVLVVGCIDGHFTGKKLKQYFDGTTADWKNARRVVTGPESMELVAGYARSFYKAISYTTGP